MTSTKSGRRSLAFDQHHRIDNEERRLLRRLEGAWDGARASSKTISQAIDIRPKAFSDIFHLTDPNSPEQIAIEMQPVVFSVPERADRLTHTLYIVVEGRLTFDRTAWRDHDNLLAHSFGTHVAYFRLKKSTLQHVYGAHFDMEEHEPGHPVFHHQMKSFKDHGTHVVAQFGVTANETEDLVKPLLNRVRTPTAHMDGFSVFAQICADHLLYKGSGADARGAFKKLLQSCNVYRGAGHRLPYLNSGDAPQCYRSFHWYP